MAAEGWMQAASVAADLIGKWWQSKEASDEAEKSRDWSQDMSNTAYTRAVRDMKAAGINPMLAAKLGGADVPSVATAQVPEIGNIGSSAMSNYMKAQEVERVSAETDNVKADTANKRASADLIRAQVGEMTSREGLNRSSALAADRRGNLDSQLYNESQARTANIQGGEREKLEAQVKMIGKELELMGLRGDELRARVREIMARGTLMEYDSSKAQRESEMYEGPVGDVIPYLDVFGRSAGGVRGLVPSMKSLRGWFGK